MGLRIPPLGERHAERDAKVTDFGGWEMPVSFDSIRTEHAAVREDVGIFDVSHMGEIMIRGSDAARLCQRLTSNDVERLAIGESQYTTIPDADGTMIDDAIIYRLDDAEFLLIPNAGKDDLIANRWRSFREEWDLTATVQNQTEDYGMLAIQGPNAASVLTDVGVAAAEIDRLSIHHVTIEGVDCLCARTGYTGEDGFELLCPWDDTATIDAAIEGQRCGLGARDTLRMEMGFVLAGNEFDREENRRTPFEANIGFAVDLDSTPPFVGHGALVDQSREGPAELLVGVVLEERGIPRSGYHISTESGEQIGMVTSGTMSPTLGDAIALGYVESEYATDGTTVSITIRGENKKARIVTPPFISSKR